MRNPEVITFMTFGDMGEAEIVKSLLEANGINCSLTHDTVTSVLPYLTSGSAIELLISSDDLTKAQEIISARFDRDEFESETQTKPRRKRTST